MKQLVTVFLLLLLLCSCQKGQPDANVADVAGRVLDVCGDTPSFLAADPDFVTTNFGEADFVEDAAIYMSEDFDGTEFGIFRLTDTKHEKEMLSLIRAYIQSEREAVESLAALYPAEELSARLARFDNAVVGTSNGVVYYLLMDAPLLERAKSALK